MTVSKQINAPHRLSILSISRLVLASAATGAAITVLVAWVFALINSVLPYTALAHRHLILLPVRIVPDEIRVATGAMASGPGIKVYYASINGYTAVSDEYVLRPPVDATFEPSVEWWLGLERDSWAFGAYVSAAYSFGWPWQAMRCALCVRSFAPLVYDVHSGMLLGPPSDPIYHSSVLPLAPVFRGFALDTLLFGFVSFLFFTRKDIRGLIRRRRGMCPRCAYDLRGDVRTGCPECGWNREGAGH